MATDITTELQDLKTDPAMQKHFEELDEHGYTILEDTLTPRQVDEAIREIAITYQEESATEHEPGTLRTHNLSARAEVFREMLQVPRVMACLAYLLGDDYILCDSGARSPMPGMQAQGLHRDGDDFMPNPPYKVHAVVPTFAQSLFALSEFTAESGATRFVPGSHVKDLDSKKIPAEDERRFICKPGACLVYDGRLMHGGAPNNTGEARYAVLNFHCRARMKPFCDHTRSIPRDIVEAASATLRRLWGFECQSRGRSRRATTGSSRSPAPSRASSTRASPRSRNGKNGRRWNRRRRCPDECRRRRRPPGDRDREPARARRDP